jgi:hypothetical protein
VRWNMSNNNLLSIRQAGLIHIEWTVLEVLECYLIIKNKLHGEIRVINK